MAKATPTVEDKIFKTRDIYTGKVILELDLTSRKDWPYWMEWLNRPKTKSFRYIGQDGTSCSVVKEIRYSFGDKNKPMSLWYAHKRLGKLRKKYLGKSEDLNYQKLKQAAFELSQRPLI